VVLVGVGEARPSAHQAREAAVELRREPVEVVGPHLVDGHQHDQ
jgi:hypothetical protein